ncbi:hypothetical protein ACFLX4_03565 [Chloroflexota bacterium]
MADERTIKRDARRMIKHGIADHGKARATLNSLSFILDDKEARELAEQLQMKWQKWCELNPDLFEQRENLWSELAEKYGPEEADRILDEKIDRGEV